MNDAPSDTVLIHVESAASLLVVSFQLSITPTKTGRSFGTPQYRLSTSPQPDTIITGGTRNRPSRTSAKFTHLCVKNRAPLTCITGGILFTGTTLEAVGVTSSRPSFGNLLPSKEPSEPHIIALAIAVGLQIGERAILKMAVGSLIDCAWLPSFRTR